MVITGDPTHTPAVDETTGDDGPALTPSRPEQDA